VIRSARSAATKVRVFPLTVGCPVDQAVSHRAAAMGSHHVCLGPGFVDEDQPRRVKASLALASLALAPSVAPRATSGRSCSAARRLFFEADPLGTEEAPHDRDRHHHATLPQLRGQHRQGQVRLLRDADEQPRVAPPAPRGARRPSGVGATLPVIRCRAAHRITLAGLSANRAATDRQLSPAPTAATARSRRSNDKALSILAGLLTKSTLDHKGAASQDHVRFNRWRKASRLAARDGGRTSINSAPHQAA
jgi:hypothetical protein